MNFFQKLKNSCARFMYGRNGVDQLGLAVVWGCLILDLISMFIRPRAAMASGVLYWIAMAAWVFAIFRIFSKNLYKRREENSRWMQIWRRLKGNRSGAKARRADKEHKYYTCKSCKAICRVPIGKGIIEITCPKCGLKIKAKT